MTIHSLLRHVGVDVPDFIFIGDEMIVEPKTEEISTETIELIGFMNSPDAPILKWLVRFFSNKTGDLKPKYLHPRELREFWGSLSLADRFYYLDVYQNGVV